MQERVPAVARDVVRAGVAAGAAGAVTLAAYLIGTLVFVTHTATVGTFFRYIASAMLGKAAYSASGADALGAAMHLVIGIGWGVGFAYVAARTPQVRARPITSGIVFGIVVMLWMQFVEIAANIYALPNSLELLNDFIAHAFFFGLPVALIVKRLERT